MNRRRMTVFPSTTDVVENASLVKRNDDSTNPGAPKRRFRPDAVLEGGKYRKLTLLAQPFKPRNGDPGRHYRCIHIVDPQGERPYCLAQKIAPGAKKNAYQVVMIRRSLDKPVYGLENPDPNLLNILSVFRFQDSLFTVFDQPGFPLSEIAVSDSPQLGIAEVRTISVEALSGVCAASAAGLHFPFIDVEDITISASNGQVKVALDRASFLETLSDDKAEAFGIMLSDLVSRVPDPLTLRQNQDLAAFIKRASKKTYVELKKDDFLRDSLPTLSLMHLVLNAQIIVFPVEHVIDAVISDLGTS